MSAPTHQALLDGARTPTRPTLTGSFGMAAATHWLAAGSAQSVLERGGNAFDAAVCAGFVLHAVEPHLNGPGGDLVGIVAPAGARPRVLDGQGPAPRGASPQRFRAEGLDVVPGSGALAAAVPHGLDALLLLLLEHGTWELEAVLEPALHYLEVGAAAGAQLVAVIGSVREHFATHWPSSAALWTPRGEAPEVGDLVRNPTYAATLRRLVAAGHGQGGATGGGGREERIEAARSELRTGFVARAVVEHCLRPHRHATGGDHRGLLTAADMADIAATFDDCVGLEFRGVQVWKAGLWTQGPVLLQALAILDHVGDEQLDLATAVGVHTVTEALKLAMADRDAYYGDAAPAATLEVLLSPDHARERARLIADEASHELRPSRVAGLVPYVPPAPRSTPGVPDVVGAAGVGEPTVSRNGVTRGDTCHVDVVDRWGNLVSLTPSGGWLQSSPAIEELGFCLGTRLQMTWLDPSSPSRLEPGRRPRTTLSPTVLGVDGTPFSALGTPGGDQQDQWQLLYLLRTIVGGLRPQAAIDAPAFHTTSIVGSFWPRTWEPGGLVVENRLGADVIAELRARGHRVTESDGWSLGRLSTVGRDPRTGLLYAAANPRGDQGYAVGR
ncbi:gamma-glutamyltranspeptidase/glutathione hydrolase [Nocardioides zeae]|uniref:Gamma-glutamyltranspeptidase/glutathione hydrolase n=1 Tax=Nocardioides zeae TaxID=1457234 RepID=A0ACC6IE08_9ACTN|nr:gamma-glutamyltransferase [Nocardioides zeae]MDR6174078.1 gamma-glutamyltranspeptidase/glutathione hydrolase [Nocardioides zeae]MDR6208885.1 gamma-glutamyltranspeptidase/glutathione hydrolase [Nocardioides zeae]